MAKATMENPSMVMDIPVKAGLDLGNGYVKSNIDGTVRVYPSVAVKQFNVMQNKPLEPDEIPDFMSDIMNQMDLSFSSPLVKSTDRRFFGNRALKSGANNLEVFDVFARTGKAEVDLSGALALGTLAADRLFRYYSLHKSLPVDNTIKAVVDLGAALPIDEHKRNAKMYRDKYLNGQHSHIVTFHNFEYPVRVELVFEYVHILNEGEAAQYGLKFAKDPFLEKIAQEAKKRYTRGELDGVTGRDLVNADNLLGIDFGEGTIDWAVFTNGRFNPDSSSTTNQGYGEVLESTLSKLQELNYPYRSRKEIAEFLQSKPNVFTKSKWDTVQEINHGEEHRFSAVISGELSKVFNRVGGFIEVIFVYGGGATPLEWTFFEQLQKRILEFGANNFIPIVYLDSSYSRFLNVQGLYQFASRLRPTA